MAKMVQRYTNMTGVGVLTEGKTDGEIKSEIERGWLLIENKSLKQENEVLHQTIEKLEDEVQRLERELNERS